MSNPNSLHSAQQCQFPSASMGTTSNAATQWCALASCVVCDDGGQNIYGFSADCELQWTISPADKSDVLYGWTIYGSDLYVQYGATLDHYSLTTIKTQSPKPNNSVALPSDTGFSAPVVVNPTGAQVQVCVLSATKG